MEFILALLFPIFPVTALYVYLLKNFPRSRVYLLILLPVVAFLTFEVFEGAEVFPYIAYFSIATSLLYAFKSLSVKSLELWLAYNYVAVISLQWVIMESVGINPLLLFGSVLPVVSLHLIVRFLELTYGGAHFLVLRGLGPALPKTSLLLSVSLVTCSAVSPVTLFVVHLTGLLSPDPITQTLLLLNWFLWGWSAIRVVSGFLFGEPREDLNYKDIDSVRFVASFGGLSASFAVGIFLVEAVL